jgi:hypothetical protein
MPDVEIGKITDFFAKPVVAGIVIKFISRAALQIWNCSWSPCKLSVLTSPRASLVTSWA